MRKLTRIRQLAKNEFLVQVCTLGRGQHIHISNFSWEDGPVFTTEREAELYARGLAGSQLRPPHVEKFAASRGKLGRRANLRSASFWHWPTLNCRVPIG